MVKTIVNAAFKAEVWTFEVKAIGAETKAINIGLEAPRGQGLASNTTSLMIHKSLIWAGCGCSAL